MESKKELSPGIKETIDKLVEQVQLDGRSVLEIPEQVAAFFAISMWQTDYEKDQGCREHTLCAPDVNAQYAAYICAEKPCWKDMIEGVVITENLMVLNTMERLYILIQKEYRPTLEDCSSLGKMMDYLLYRISLADEKGCFFTPVQIADLMCSFLKPEGGGMLWDPACGSGTFLMCAKNNDENLDICGTDKNARMVHIARVNAFFHGVYPKHGWGTTEIKTEDFMESHHMADYILTNPPVSSSLKTDKPYGHIAPTTAVHLQFLQKIPEHLKKNGKAAVLINEATLFSKNIVETNIRKALVENFGLHTVISLPKGAFAPYTNAKASVLFFGREPSNDDFVMFFELKNLGYSLNRKRNAVSQNDIPVALEKEKSRYGLYEKWQNALQEKTVYNGSGISTPVTWKEEICWFADRNTIRKKQYDLLADTYKPIEEEEQVKQKSLGELLTEMSEMEKRTQEELDYLKQFLIKKNFL